MVQPTFPGVYIREVSSGVRTITGVATSITAFVGEAKTGVMFEPTRVLGFTDYERIFSADTSLGEMTEQVRQFFLNGGSQAFIVRVASNAFGAGIILDNSAGAAVLTLTAKSQGTASNSLRASVSYKSAAPERLFNLRVYRELFDASGTAQIVEEELHKDLSMDASSPRFIKTILEQQSLHVTALQGALTLTPGFSASGKLFATPAATKTAIQQAIQGTASTTVGGFRIKYGTEPFRDVNVLLSDAQEAGDNAGLEAIRDGIIAALNLGATAVTVAHDVANGPIFIRAGASTSPGAPNVDIVIERAPLNDISVALHLGVGQGGLEASATSDDRPAPNGFVSQIGPVSGTVADQLNTLLEFANAAPGSLTGISLTGVKGFPTVPFSLVLPGGATRMAELVLNGDRTLATVAMRLQIIADAINADTVASPNWRAEVHGVRLALIPRFGDANAGVGHTIGSTGTYVLAEATPAPANLFGGVIANVAAYSLGIGTQPPGGFQTVPAVNGAGSDGDVPTLTNYRLAFNEIDKKVDLFNIMVLPRSARTPGETRRGEIWGEASTFCQRRRAFLIVDYGPAVTTFEQAFAGRIALRAGVVGDHAAVFWPPVKIPVNGTTKSLDPSGSVAGIMSRVDSVRGVWKAPAGLEADIRGVVAVSVPMSDPENGVLNPEAINAIRSFPNGIVVWGSRTLSGFDNSGNDDYKYVPVRRFALFIEESLYRGVKFAVFEPNAEPLWSALRTAVGAFMNNLFRQGAFAGKTTREAYFVKVDSETTTQNDINLGIVNVVVGFAPLKPAEFVVITIKQQAGQVQV